LKGSAPSTTKIYPTRKNGFVLIALFGAALRQWRSRQTGRPALAAARGTDDLLAAFHSTDEICRFDGFCPELIAH
jgi:hypothetical protein